MCKKIKHNRIDKCMKDLIKYLNNANIPTIACCCGHRRYPKTIIVRVHPNCGNNPIELLTMTEIPRKRKFYKRDKKGYYYIPEVSKPKN